MQTARLTRAVTPRQTRKAPPQNYAAVAKVRRRRGKPARRLEAVANPHTQNIGIGMELEDRAAGRIIQPHVDPGFLDIRIQ